MTRQKRSQNSPPRESHIKKLGFHADQFPSRRPRDRSLFGILCNSIGMFYVQSSRTVNSPWAINMILCLFDAAHGYSSNKVFTPSGSSVKTRSFPDCGETPTPLIFSVGIQCSAINLCNSSIVRPVSSGGSEGGCDILFPI